jgi:xanthine dehydrogenase accessory factor
MATIVQIEGSSSRPLGSRMICTDKEEFSGAVSGGCVETDICRVAGDVLADQCARIVHYGRVQDPLFEVGLNCEGEIDVLVEPLDDETVTLWEQPFTGVVVVQGRIPESSNANAGDADAGEVGDARDVGDARERSGAVRRALVKRTWYADTMAYGRGLVRDAWIAGECRRSNASAGFLLAEPVLPPPALLIFGAGPIADDLARLARVMGYTTIISDPRETRFPPGGSPADRVCCSWPDETLATLREEKVPLIPARTFIVSLEHEPRFEDALWEALLRHIGDDEAASRRPIYIGAIGRPERAIERDQRARETGLDLEALSPIKTPIGLDIGGKSSPEVALSILAQIVATVHRRDGGHHGMPRVLGR